MRRNVVKIELWFSCQKALRLVLDAALVGVHASVRQTTAIGEFADIRQASESSIYNRL